VADESAISWTDATFNPWIGCAKVSPACAHCYAETLAVNRMGLRDEKAVWGAGAARRITADATWRKPLRWERLAQEGLLPNGKENPDGHRPRVFCASMADVFEPRYDLESSRWRLFDLIAATPSLDWLILTKRPEVARTFLVDGRQATPDEVDEGYELGWAPPLYYDGRAGTESGDIGPVPLPNVWLGVSIENSRFTWRADVLREIPAVVRFISAEPLLGSLFEPTPAHGRQILAGRRLRGPLYLGGIDWVIIGGESGGRASRPMRAGWARELRDAVLDRATRLGESRPALHFKQWGSYDEDGVYRGPSPKASGKLLDAVEWCEFPRVAVPA
jgi:protein gp37